MGGGVETLLTGDGGEGGQREEQDGVEDTPVFEKHDHLLHGELHRYSHCSLSAVKHLVMVVSLFLTVRSLSPELS